MNEPFTLHRDCAAVKVPQGEEVVLPAGRLGYITQALGGSFTIYMEGNLFRIAGHDHDALGKPSPDPLTLPADASDADVEKLVWEQLHTVFDPEIPINVVDLGLVYELTLLHTGKNERTVYIKMTLTAPGCGMGDIMIDDACTKLKLIPSVVDVDIEMVFEPPWNYSMMSDDAKLETGML